METVKFLLGDLSSDIRAVNVYRFTPLHSAVHFAGNYEIAKFLLEAGAPIDATDQNGWNVLHMAAAKGLQPIVEMLVDKGVDFDQTTLANHSPLLIAACNGHEDTVRYLLSKSTTLCYFWVQKVI
jgi:cytohesin